MQKICFFAIAAAFLTSVTAASEAAGQSEAIRSAAAIERLGRTASGQFSVRTEPVSGMARFVRAHGTGDLMPGPWADKGKVFLRQHGRLFGLRDVDRELGELSDRIDELSLRTVTYQQRYNGVPVFGARLNTSTDSSGRLTRINGSLLPEPEVSIVPNIGQSEAADRAIAHLRRSASPHDLGSLSPSSGKLYVYNAGFVRHRAGRDQLVYEVEVNGTGLREFVYIDAHSGKVADQITGTYDTIDRRIYNGGFGPSYQVWQEGSSTPTGTAAWDELIDFSLDTYNLASSISHGGYLSWDGTDGVMHAVNNHPAIQCPNAQFAGSYIRFCDGTTTDDIVGHEWFHGFTQETHGLIYLNQSGAINEAYSDIFGEVIDFLNQGGSDSPGAARSDLGCSVFGGAGIPSLTVNAPAVVAGGYVVGGANFNPPGAGSVTASVVTATPSEACSAVSGDVAGSIALIDRGTCTFVTKVLNAQAAGAVAAIVVNNANDDVITMGGENSGITIPSVFIGQTEGAALRNAPNVTATLAPGSANDNSYRWLMGEDADPFGGAIRDMWSPNCFGDPGKVSDRLYACDPGGNDNGGVHSNSGIINHGFALLVDGGTYNGQTITAIGLTKAVHLYWRAMTTYQTPVTGYSDHAAALQASCSDLLDVNLRALSTETGLTDLSGEVISAADCAAVDQMILAVELNQSPTQCNFATLLSQDPPALCPAGEAASAVIDEDFDDGLNDWIADSGEIANSATFDIPDWAAVGDLPFGRPGQAAFGANPVIGDCNTDIEAGVTFLESPSFTVPAGGRLVFEHSVSTEKDWDGGNLKVNVNGVGYQLIDASAFEYNAYNGSLNSSDNPLGGEPAFHGSDGGTFLSAFGESHIDLTAVANPGDQVKLRFELGADGCNGLIGWYVDRVRAFSCLPDFDDDGVADVDDAFPSDPNEWNDNDNDSIGDNSDPDDDDDGIADGLDTDPLIASNACTSRSSDGLTATMAEGVTELLTCAARRSIAVLQPTSVQPPGNLVLIAPAVTFDSGFSASDLTVISADACPDC